MFSNTWYERQAEAKALPLVAVVSREERTDQYGCVTGVTEVLACGHVNRYAPRVARTKRRCAMCKPRTTGSSGASMP